ncbi:ABC transporter ATP-binding protein [Bordetella sp. H567]|uniref:ABC transporter ATP-binding protein n=1 Tax=Bordetella sp. H567 TaxID=1697043 RepID=UPI00083196DF
MPGNLPPQAWPAADACLDIAGLRAGYGAREVIPGLTMAGLRPGRIAAVLGPNGSGKSTLLKAVAGLVPPRGGAIMLDGVDLARVAPRIRAQRVAYVPQDLPSAVHLRVLEAVLASGRAQASGARDTHRVTPEMAQALLTRLDLGPLSLRYLDELSGGQRQLTGLALALIRRPRILLLDEPLSALDPRHQFQIMALLRRETVEQGLITVLVVHDINVALRHADRVIMLRDGALAADGAPAEAIAPATLEAVYGVRGRVEQCSLGLPYAIIDGIASTGEIDATAAPDTGKRAARSARTD